VLVEIVAAARLTDIHDLELQGAVADFPSAKLAIRHVAMCFVVHPDPLVLPVIRVERVEVVEEVDLPAPHGRLVRIPRRSVVIDSAFSTCGNEYRYGNDG